MDRLSPPEQLTPVAKRSAADREIAASKQDHSEATVLGRMLSRVPYIDDMSIGPHPQVSKITTGIPYTKSGNIDLSGAKQALAKVPRLNETYIDPPTADRPLPKITHVERVSASSRTSVKPRITRKNNPVIEKQPYSKYADESISPLPVETKSAEQDIVQQPSKVIDEMGPRTGSPAVEQNSPGLATPAGVLLPDRSVPSTSADYSQPVQPKGVELEFLR